MRYFLLVMALGLIARAGSGQRWIPAAYTAPTGKNLADPLYARSLRVDATALRNLLFSAPHENLVRAEDSPVLLNLPSPDAGKAAIYRIVKYDLTAADDRFPHIATWYGVNEAQPEQTIFLDWTERGFHAAVRGGEAAWFVDPLPGTTSEYLFYHTDQYAKADEHFTCTAEVDAAPAAGRQLPPSGGDCVLRQYRIAVTAAVPYSNFHGASSVADAGLVHSAIVTTLNRINQVYSRELSVRLQLIAGNDQLYFYGVADNPFSDNDVSVLVNENQSLQRTIIGNENYDLGHVFTQGFNNGRAFLRSGCDPDLKSGGATSLDVPLGDPFNIDYVAHEIGHQLGANHTQNNACNYSPRAGMEPGSGSTIMGYAGICVPNVQARSDAYFHGRSIEEITLFTEDIFNGARCAAIINNSLTNPRVTPIADQTIPRGTPLRLRGQASGSGNLSYNWEQYDPEQATMPPEGNSVQGPLFRSFPPGASGERFLPRFAEVLQQNDPEWEELPEVSREMDFRLTVINANAAYGCAGETDIRLTVDGNKGPFSVTDPYPQTQWSVGQTAQVQWDVAGTDGAAFNSPRVDILLSTDGGVDFAPLATNVPNNGLAEITVPDSITEQAIIMVRSTSNVFYNISQRKFVIADSAGAPGITLRTVGNMSVTDCFAFNNPARYEFATQSFGGAGDSLEFTVAGLPAGVSAVFLPENPRPGGRFSLLLNGLSTLSQGTYEAEVRYSGPYGSVNEAISFTKLGIEPLAGPGGMFPTGFSNDIRPVLSAEDNGADRFQIQVASDAGFTNLLFDRTSSSPSFALPSYLDPNTRVHWRIRSIQNTGSCGLSLWNQTSFISGDCPIQFTSSPAVTISNGPPVQLAEMKLNITSAGELIDLDLVLLDVSHTYLNDLEIELESPAGTLVPIFDRSCGGNDNLLLSFDDEATELTFTCPPVDPTAFIRPPTLPLRRFDGEEAAGTWTLRVRDNSNQDGGTINSFGLKTCFEPVLLPVSWQEFRATARKTDVLLTWSVSAATDNHGFFVERASGSSLDEWTVLGFVSAEQPYQFTDQTALPDTDYFYRLRQVDLNGRVQYSDLRSARIGADLAASLRVFPNPAGDWLSYEWTSVAPSDATKVYQLTDTRGRIVRKGVLLTSGGSISLQGLPAGIFFLRVPGSPVIRVAHR